jgi:hypothetical protein
MLIHQTAAAFNLWTGRDIGLDFVQRRLDEVRNQPRAAAPAAAAASASSEE